MTIDNETAAKLYIQGSIALLPATFEDLVLLLTRLWESKPHAAKSESGAAAMFEDFADDIMHFGYCYQAVKEGCAQYRRSENIFFPQFFQLKNLIHPIHWRLKIRVERLAAVLEKHKES